MNTFLQLFIANVKETVRDRMAMFWFVAFPIVFILIFGAIFSNVGESVTFNLGVVQEDSGPIGAQVEKALRAVPVFAVHSGSQKNELERLKQGENSAVVIIPEGLTATITRGGTTELPFYYDSSQVTNEQVLIPLLNRTFSEIESRITNKPKLFVLTPKTVLSVKLRQIDYLLPGILAMALMQLGLFGSLRLVSLRERKILKRLGATPLPRSLLLASEVLVRLIMSLVQATLIIVIGRLVFDVVIISKWWVIGLWVLLGAAAFVSLGYMLVSFARTEESGQGIIQLVQFPMMFLAGIFFPISIMPEFLRPIVKAIPLTYLGDALRQVMTGTPPFYPIRTDLMVMSAWLIGSLVIGYVLFRWD